MKDNRERAEFLHQTIASGDVSDPSVWGMICNALDEAEARGLLRAARICECAFGSLTTSEGYETEMRMSRLIRAAIKDKGVAGYRLPEEGGFKEKVPMRTCPNAKD